MGVGGHAGQDLSVEGGIIATGLNSGLVTNANDVGRIVSGQRETGVGQEPKISKIVK